MIAEHLFRARDPNSLALLDRAARRAERLWLLDRARHLWRWSLLAASGHCDPEYKKIVPPIPAILSDRHRHLVSHFARILQTQAYFSEAGYLYRRLATDAAYRRQRTSEAAFRLQAARVDWLAGNYARARRPASLALRLARATRERKLEGLAYYLAGDIDRRTGRMAAGQKALERAVRILGEVGDRDDRADALNALGLVHWGLGRLAEAQTSFRAALTMRARSGDPAKRAQIANNLGLLLEEAGRLNAAQRYYRRAFDIFDTLGARRNRAYALGNLANLYRHGAQYERARAAYEEVEWELRAIGEQHAAAYTVGNLGDLAHDFGDYPAAADLYQRTLRFARQVGDAELIAESNARLAEIAWRQGRHSEAARLLRQAHTAAHQAQSRKFTLHGRLLEAEIALERGNERDVMKQFVDAGREAAVAGLLYYQLWALSGHGRCLLEHQPADASRLGRTGYRQARRCGYRWWQLHCAVLGAAAQAKAARATRVPSEKTETMLKQALVLKTDIEGTIGDPAVLATFQQLPVIRTLDALAMSRQPVSRRST
ncbi:MAG: tetratricopeptide repeat protein [candidate division Zixibacteria bacterium]|nr:tetratricopeptide repeat protein [candidate division Zixibacteria bacterium]